jgi:hypothetical protein
MKQRYRFIRRWLMAGAPLCTVVALGACGHPTPGATAAPPTTAGAAASAPAYASTTVFSRGGPPPSAAALSSPPVAVPTGSSLPSVTANTAVPWSPTSANTVVGDTGNAARWPASQTSPPSLRGAFGGNMLTVMLTLIRYEDWVASHPDPALVSRYMVPGVRTYQAERSEMVWLSQRGWHLAPRPTEVDWLAVTMAPSRIMGGSSHPVRIGGHVAHEPSALNVVLTLASRPYLNRTGAVVGHSVGEGKRAFAVTLAQGQTGQWRIYSITELAPNGGLERLMR